MKKEIINCLTYLANRVEELNCGYVLDATKDINIMSFLGNLSVKSINEIIERVYNLDKTLMIDDPQGIINRVKELT